jgi:L-threonylcarbamoyladenylate synthase
MTLDPPMAPVAQRNGNYDLLWQDGRVTESAAPEESAPEESAPEESAPEESAPEESASDNPSWDVTDEADLGHDFERYDCTGDAADLVAATEAARKAIEAGECIVLPTDTVYGIGADAFSPEAVRRLLEAKNRGRDMPPPVLIGEATLIRALATDVPDSARELVARHWPGALTVICHIQPSLRMDLGDTGGTIALRVPDHDLARDILRRTGPMAVSSANLSGQPAALTCDDAIDQLGDSVSVYLDGGTLGGGSGAPSTIVDFTRTDDGEVLRHGAISLAELRETLPGVIDLTADLVVEAESDPDVSIIGEDATADDDDVDALPEPDNPDQPGLFDEPADEPDVEPSARSDSHPPDRRTASASGI